MQKKNAYNLKIQDLFQKYIELEKKYTTLQSKLKDISNPSEKYKTELCKKFQSTGFCPYGNKCQFAHGKEELIIKNQGKNYKKRFCKSFHEKGYCPYGSRCNFRHDEKTFNETNLSYYYFRLFLFKNYFSESSLNCLTSIGSNLIKDRLPVFKSMTQNLSKNENFNKIQETEKDDFFEINFERKYSQSTVSNTSYEDDKKLNFNNSNEINFTNFKSY